MDEKQDRPNPGLQPFEDPEEKRRRETGKKKEAQGHEAEETRREIEQELVAERRLSQRRQGPDHHDTEHVPETAYRGNQQRRFKDRRVRKSVVRLKTAETTENLEAWLEENCEARWAILVDGVSLVGGVSDDQVERTLRVMFELKTDRDLFRAAFVSE